MSTPITQKLESRGYWRVEIRPTAFVERRVSSIKVLQECIEKARVELRGWDFPHIGRSWELPDSQTRMGLETDWSSHVETWTAFLSGQFVYRGGVWTDWLDQHHSGSFGQKWKPGEGMPIVSTVWSVAEFCEFAARYSQTEAGGDSTFIEISFHGLKGRVLFGDHERRVWFEQYGPAKMNDFVFSRTLSRAELISTAGKVAVACASELFEAFGWQASPDLLDSIQAELFQLKRGV